MEDWRYENLRDRIDRLQDEIREVRGRTNKVENWQSLMPFRIWMGIWGLIIAAIWIAVIVDAMGALAR